MKKEEQKEDLNNINYTIINMKKEWIICAFILIIIILGYTGYSVTIINNKVNSLFDNTEFTKTNENIEKSVVLILVKKDNINSFGVGSIYVDDKGEIWGKGTGFAIKDGSIIMTAKHVVDGQKEIKILINGKDSNTKIIDVAFHPQLDLALIKTNLTLKPLNFDDRDSVSVGSKIAFIGFPLDNELQNKAITNDGIISSINQIGTFGDNKPVIMYTINSFVNFGNSGGPVFLADSGKVIGIINARESSKPILSLPTPDNFNKFSDEGKTILSVQIAMFNELVKNSQVGIGYTTSINKDVIDKLSII